MSIIDSVDFEALIWPDDQEALLGFLCQSEWPFHSPAQINRAACEQRMQSPDFLENVEYFWIKVQGKSVGLLKLFELDDISDDGAPLFDLRLHEDFRGKGIGPVAVNWLNRYLFKKWPSLQRIEGTTREDNFAMQKVFIGCGYAKEGHIRRGWGNGQAAILYGILREDWENGVVTPVPWDN